jgi:enoyl-CoA hydratase/carnithine racemase
MPESQPEDLVQYALSRGVALLTLNRPERLNAWSPPLERAYGRALDRATADPDVRAIVVTGAGRAFCAGADATVLRGYGSGKRPQANSLPRPQTEFELQVPKPVIAAINGPCVGIGLIRALLCDIRFAAEDSYVSTIYARRGLVAEHGSSWLLPAMVGQATAADLLLSARRVGAKEAQAMGLINRVVQGSVVDAALEYAEDIATFCAPTALSVIKQQLWEGAKETLRLAYEDAERHSELRYDSEDFVEGITSWREKRTPRFAPLDFFQDRVR